MIYLSNCKAPNTVLPTEVLKLQQSLAFLAEVVHGPEGRDVWA